MLTAFSSALTALNANGVGIDVVGNNLANLNTTGFKASTTHFDDLMSQTLSDTLQVGKGVGQAISERIFSEGSIQTSTGQYDSAIQGSGFYIVKQGTSELYTRDGSFKLDKDGYLVTQTGERVQGYVVTDGQIQKGQGYSDIQADFSEHGGTATANISAGTNLDATAAVAPTTGAPSYSTATTIYDSKGQAHQLELDFWNNGANVWSLGVKIDGTAATVTTNDTAADANVTFTSSGALDTSTGNATQATFDGPDGTPITWNFLDSSGKPLLSQYADKSSISSLTADGNAAAQFASAKITDGGYLEVTYSDGTKENVADLAIATFQNPDSLVAVGNNDFVRSGATSQPVKLSAIESSSQVLGGRLEASTVDIATEFTNLMTYQRSYQAAAKVVTAADEITQDTVNLLH